MASYQSVLEVLWGWHLLRIKRRCLRKLDMINPINIYKVPLISEVLSWFWERQRDGISDIKIEKMKHTKHCSVV